MTDWDGRSFFHHSFLTGGTFLHDVWLFDDPTSTWRLRTPTTSTTQLYGVYSGSQQRPGSRYSTNVWGLADSIVVYGGLGLSETSIGVLADVWQFHLRNNSWTFLSGSNSINAAPIFTAGPSQNPGPRSSASTWAVGNSLYLYGGYLKTSNPFLIDQSFSADLWVYDLPSRRWSHIEGPALVNAPLAIYTGIDARPGGRLNAVSWSDDAGNLYLYAGQGSGPNTGIAGEFGYLDDLWRYSTADATWTFVTGTQTLHSPGSATLPAGRDAPLLWRRNCDNIWLMGGRNRNGILNDLWKYTPTTNTWSVEVRNLLCTHTRTQSFSRASLLQSSSGWAVGPYAVGVYGTLGFFDACNYPGARTGAGTWVSDGRLWFLGGEGVLSIPIAPPILSTIASDSWSLSIPEPASSVCFVPTTVPPPTTTIATPIPGPTTATGGAPTSAASSGRDEVPVAAIVVPIVLILLLLLVLAFFLWRRRNRNRHQTTFFVESDPATEFKQSPMFKDNPWKSTVDMSEVMDGPRSSPVVAGSARDVAPPRAAAASATASSVGGSGKADMFTDEEFGFL